MQRDLDDGCREAAAFLSSLTNLVSPGGHLFVFFFDADSAEQHFVTNVWESVAPFPGTGRDFTHRLLLDHLKNSRGSTTTRHHNGTMVSPDFAHAERWFMDGHFKSFPVLADDHGVRESVHSFLTHHTREEGSVRVPAGMYVTTFTRI